jgi:hypothetical protein
VLFFKSQVSYKDWVKATNEYGVILFSMFEIIFWNYPLSCQWDISIDIYPGVISVASSNRHVLLRNGYCSVTNTFSLGMFEIIFLILLTIIKCAHILLLFYLPKEWVKRLGSLQTNPEKRCLLHYSSHFGVEHMQTTSYRALVVVV